MSVSSSSFTSGCSSCVRLCKAETTQTYAYMAINSDLAAYSDLESDLNSLALDKQSMSTAGSQDGDGPGRPAHVSDVETSRTHDRTMGSPYLEIIEQPKQRGFRFRYPCEGPSHGGLPGESSEKQRKVYPTVRLSNYNGRAARVVVSLICCDDPLRPHAHSLVGKSVVSGQCTVEVNADTKWMASFPNLGILHVTKKNVSRVLLERYALALVGPEPALESPDPSPGEELAGGASALNALPKEDVTKLRQLADEQARTMNLSAIRLCFQVRSVSSVLNMPSYNELHQSLT